MDKAPTPVTTPKPVEPELHECCAGNCSPCVWDTYYAELHQWRLDNGEPSALVKPKRNMLGDDFR